MTSLLHKMPRAWDTIHPWLPEGWPPTEFFYCISGKIGLQQYRCKKMLAHCPESANNCRLHLDVLDQTFACTASDNVSERSSELDHFAQGKARRWWIWRPSFWSPYMIPVSWRMSLTSRWNGWFSLLAASTISTVKPVVLNREQKNSRDCSSCGVIASRISPR